MDRTYHKCGNCHLIFLEPSLRLAADDEKQRYDTHQNDPDDEAYRKFLSQVTDPLLSRLKPGSVGLDYGSGPGPAIAPMLGEKGMTVYNFDPFYAPDQCRLELKYDFITCTETAEHFFSPGIEFRRMEKMLNSMGVIAVMTKVFEADQTGFEGWWYKDDPTHVSFYMPQTLLWISETLGLRHERLSDNVVFFSKEM